MATVDRYARCVAERTISPPLTSGDTLHWDGLGAVSRVWRPQKEALLPPLPCATPYLHQRNCTPRFRLHRQRSIGT